MEATTTRSPWLRVISGALALGGAWAIATTLMKEGISSLEDVVTLAAAAYGTYSFGYFAVTARLTVGLREYRSDSADPDRQDNR